MHIKHSSVVIKKYNTVVGLVREETKKYSLNVGMTRHIFVKGRPLAPSRFMKKDRRIYDECKRLFFMTYTTCHYSRASLGFRVVAVC